jgi:hypothetical protein
MKRESNVCKSDKKIIYTDELPNTMMIEENGVVIIGTGKGETA